MFCTFTLEVSISTNRGGGRAIIKEHRRMVDPPRSVRGLHHPQSAGFIQIAQIRHHLLTRPPAQYALTRPVPSTHGRWPLYSRKHLRTNMPGGYISFPLGRFLHYIDFSDPQPAPSSANAPFTNHLQKSEGASAEFGLERCIQKHLRVGAAAAY